VVSGRLVVSATLVVLCAAAPARAEQQDARELEAKKACLANKPDRGIELLAELYAETNDPTYIYNQGRCYQQNGRGADALVRFREYLRKATTLPDADKAEVQRVIAELEAQQEQQRKAEAPVVAPVPAPVAPAPRADRPGLKLAGIVTASVGVVALGGAMYMGYRAQQLSDEVTADAKNKVFSSTKYQDGQRAETLQWIGYGVGGVALLSGAMLYAFGAGLIGGESGSVTVAPTVTPEGGGGAAVSVSF
jgi:hypothetical protein